MPGPTPSSWFTGSLKEVQKDSTPPLQLVEWEKQYGETYGYMEGANRVIVTSDLDVLHDVFIRKFENFHGRRVTYKISVIIDQKRAPSLWIFLTGQKQQVQIYCA